MLLPRMTEREHVAVCLSFLVYGKHMDSLRYCMFFKLRQCWHLYQATFTDPCEEILSCTKALGIIVGDTNLKWHKYKIGQIFTRSAQNLKKQHQEHYCKSAWCFFKMLASWWAALCLFFVLLIFHVSSSWRSCIVWAEATCTEGTLIILHGWWYETGSCKVITC